MLSAVFSDEGVDGDEDDGEGDDEGDDEGDEVRVPAVFSQVRKSRYCGVRGSLLNDLSPGKGRHGNEQWDVVRREACNPSPWKQKELTVTSLVSSQGNTDDNQQSVDDDDDGDDISDNDYNNDDKVSLYLRCLQVAYFKALDIFLYQTNHLFPLVHQGVTEMMV